MTEPAAGDFDGLLLVGHGTRDPAGLNEFWQLVEMVRGQQPDLPVEGCFLELAEPSIAAGLGNLVRRGAHRVRAVPLVLFAAGHAKRDIPQALSVAAREHSGVFVEQSLHLGCHVAIIELSEWRFRQAIRDQNAAPTGETLLLLVGRGSSDVQATREMQRFAACRACCNPSVPLQFAFIAMAEPRWSRPWRGSPAPAGACVVQPHLLFCGLLLEELRGTVGRMALQVPEKQWIVAGPLGPDIRLATAVSEIARQKTGSAWPRKSEPSRPALRLEG